VSSILERIKRGHWWKFHGGIHPPEQKFITNNKPIRNLPLPDTLILPLKQHIGQQGELLVKMGDKVLKGQALTHAQQPMAVPIHAPTSGTIVRIANAVIAHPSGLSEPCLFLKADGKDQWLKRNICPQYTKLSSQELIAKIANAGIAGMGGAGFPTHIKVSAKAVKYLVINAAECEPYITADDLLMREHSSEIVEGIKILNHILSPEQILIGIEDNKPEAIAALQQATENLANIHVCILPTKYPTGGEKQLIKILTGLEVPQGALPNALGIVVQNIATCFAVADAVINDTPLIRRVVTLTGDAIAKPQNVWGLLGTPIHHLLSHCEYQVQKPERLIMGGPLMGYSLPSSDIAITKTSNCILAPSISELASKNQEIDCIRCGQCSDVCPSQLLPQELQWFAKAKDQEQLKKFNLFDCIECGACAYVCPSQIPLVHYYRIAKAEIRQQQIQDLKAEKAKARFEARKVRLIKEKLKREEKHQKAAEARKAAMNSNSSDANNAKSVIAAALARAKAKKAGTVAATTSSEKPEAKAEQIESIDPIIIDDKKAQVAAAIARAKAKKAKKAQPAHPISTASIEHSEIVESPAKTTATTAKAESKQTKNKKTIEKKVNDTKKTAKKKKTSKTKTSESTTSTKKKAIKSVAAKAAATKEAATKAVATKSTKNNSATNKSVENQDKVLSKTEKIANAVAKAKAKKAKAQQKEQSADSESTKANKKTNENKSALEQDKNKKKRIAAAVAKAKAKKQLQQKTNAPSQQSNQQEESS
jgi:H+/Na+-translocating ferredoxin:NAD+ oxidoreductase subunit C